jgi:hypothetical protein
MSILETSVMQNARVDAGGFFDEADHDKRMKKNLSSKTDYLPQANFIGYHLEP